MAKRSAKKYLNYDTRKETTTATSIAILNKLAGVDENTFLNTIYYTSQDVIIRKLLNKVEYILLDAISNPRRFEDNLHSALDRLAKEIITNGWLPKFIEMSHHVLEYHRIRGQNDVTGAYFDIILQLTAYMTPVGTVLIGVDKDGAPLHVAEKYPGIEKIVFMTVKEFEKKPNSDIHEFISTVIKRFNNSGFRNVKTYEDIEYLFKDEQLTTNTLYAMSPFIQSLDSPLLDFPYIEPAMKNFNLQQFDISIEDIKTALKNRRRLLPRDGVAIEQIGQSEGISNLWMKEQLYCDNLYMLYKLNIGGNNLVGYFNNSSGFFFSVFTDAQDGFAEVNQVFEKLILGIYAQLATDLDVGIEMYTGDKEKRSQGNPRATRRLDRNNLYQDTIDVDFYIRKLPVGATASEEAIERAKKLGIKLYPDETFVRPFTRKAYNKQSSTGGDIE